MSHVRLSKFFGQFSTLLAQAPIRSQQQQEIVTLTMALSGLE
jgi:hypothetical protein